MKAEMLYSVIIDNDPNQITALFYNKEDANWYIHSQPVEDYQDRLSVKRQRVIWCLAENKVG